jgi:dihydrofolate reductase
MSIPLKSLIVAMTRDRVIGLNGKIPWHISKDLKLFKKLTLGNTVIMGRRTFESLGKPLPKRNNIVISRVMEKGDGFEVFPSLDIGIKSAEQLGREIFFIGGGELYRQVLGLCDRMYISWVKGQFQGDTYFPEIDFSNWGKSEETEFPEFTQTVYVRKNKA